MGRKKRASSGWFRRIVLGILRVIAGAGPVRLGGRAQLGASGSRRGGLIGRIRSTPRAPFTGRRLLGPERARPRLHEPVARLAEQVEEFVNAEQPLGHVVAAEVGARIVRLGLEPCRLERWDRRARELVVEQVPVRRLMARLNQLDAAECGAQPRVLPPAPGQPLVQVELAHPLPRSVRLESLLDTPSHRAFARLARLPMILGEAVDSRPFLVDLADLPHLLVVGGTATERDALVSAVVASVLAVRSPEEVRVLLVGGDTTLRWLREVPHALGSPRSADRTADVLARLDALIAHRLAAASEAARPGDRQSAREVESAAPTLLLVLPDLGLVDGARGDVTMAPSRRGAGSAWKATPSRRPGGSARSTADTSVRSIDRSTGVGVATEATLERILAIGPSVGIHVVAASAVESATSPLARLRAWTCLGLAMPAVAARRVLGEAGAERLGDQGDFLFRDAGTGALRRGQAPIVDVRWLFASRKAWATVAGDDWLRRWFAGRPTDEDPARAELERQARAVAAESPSVTPRVLERRLRVGSALARALWEQLQAEGRV